MIKKLITITLLLAATFGSAQDKPAYVLFNAGGKKVGYQKMVRKLTQQDIVLFGEFHNNPISHWMELSLAKDLAAFTEMVFGAEMFEADNQQPLNDYLSGKINDSVLETAARLWKNYKTDYAPLVNFAKEKKIPFIATNIPRRYAAMVSKGGFGALDTLSSLEKTWMAPLPMDYDSTLPGYRKMVQTMAGHGGPNLPRAQASKDATMAWSILQHLKPNTIFLHFNGAYHSENYDGINWYLKRKHPELRIVTITTVSQKDLNKLLDENKGKADYIIVVDTDMTNTYIPVP